MNQREKPSPKDQPVSLQPLGHYVTPALPTTGALRMFASKFRQRFSTKTSEPFIADDQHSKASAEKLHGIAATPACGSLQLEIDRTFDAYVSPSSSDSSIQVVVLPPCDESNVMKTWAFESSFDVVDPPSRQSLMGNELVSKPELTGVGVLVIPNLERWFLRSHDGLHAIRALLNSLDHLERKCIIGCNSWAWAFLSKALQVNLLLPSANTLVAFDDVRLHAWLAELALSENEEAINFRSTESGENIFDINEDGALKCNYITILAARSYGVPWVAWHLWRNSIRSVDGELLKKKRTELGNNELSQHTTWLAPLVELTFPTGSTKDQLLVLHALLLHGSLTASELAYVLDGPEYWNLVPSLINAKIIKKEHENVHCHPMAYGVIRDALSTAGYSMDVL